MAVGSPPRAWGRLDASQSRCTCAYRFTPTCVGKTSRSVRRVRRRSGSPPRAWGRPLAWRRWRSPDRFTPTCVGKTAGRRLAIGLIARFTPTCVGKTSTLCVERQLHGSPPRAWGRRDDQRCSVRGPVHPHVRGEDAARRCTLASDVGSPPRAWGRRCESTDAVVGTPGSPPRAWGRRSEPRGPSDWPVHPHVRGEDASCDPGSRRSVHPHVRGDNTSLFVDFMGSGSAKARRSLRPFVWSRRTPPIGIPASTSLLYASIPAPDASVM